MLRSALRFSNTHRVLHPIGRMSARCALHFEPTSTRILAEPEGSPTYNVREYALGLEADVSNWVPAETSASTSALQRKFLCPNKVVRWLDISGTALFASSGCLTAGAAGLDMYGCCVVGAVTGLGGGTIRDMILGGNNNTEGGSTAVFWINEPEYLKLALGVAFATFCAWKFLDTSNPDSLLQARLIHEAMFLMDSVGLGIFAIIGVNNALRMNLAFLPAMLCAALTSTGGGMVRDVLCQRPVRVLNVHEESYVTAPLLAAAVYQLSAGMLPLGPRIASGVLSCVAMRYFSTATGFRLPTLHAPKTEQVGAA